MHRSNGGLRVLEAEASLTQNGLAAIERVDAKGWTDNHGHDASSPQVLTVSPFPTAASMEMSPFDADCHAGSHDLVAGRDERCFEVLQLLPRCMRLRHLQRHVYERVARYGFKCFIPTSNRRAPGRRDSGRQPATANSACGSCLVRRQNFIQRHGVEKVQRVVGNRTSTIGWTK